MIRLDYFIFIFIASSHHATSRAKNETIIFTSPFAIIHSFYDFFMFISILIKLSGYAFLGHDINVRNIYLYLMHFVHVCEDAVFYFFFFIEKAMRLFKFGNEFLTSKKFCLLKILIVYFQKKNKKKNYTKRTLYYTITIFNINNCTSILE